MKRLALVLAIICMATKVSAGILPGFDFGVKAGLNYQAHDFKTVVSNLNIKSSAGWFAGAVADIHWEKFGIKPEVQFLHNKFDIEGADGSLKVSQLDIPVLLYYSVLPSLDIQVGPRFCVMEDAQGTTENVEWMWKSPTLGYAIGIEFSVWKLGITARYNGSFKASEVLGYSTGTNRINTFQLGLGFYF